MKRARATIPFVLTVLTVAGVGRPAFAQEYKSSVVGTDFDFIVDSDPSTFICLEFHGQRLREMPDKTNDEPLVQPALVFMAYYEDGTKVDLALDADFSTESAAREEALRYATRLGKLPTTLRDGVKRIVVHAGPTEATAFGGDGAIILYSANATKRIATHDLEETLFHESVHAAWDNRHRDSPAWLAAQAADGAFITAYAAKQPREDLAESALFAYTLVHHPERIPAEHAARIRGLIPARIAFVEKLVPPGESIFHSVGPRYPCDGSGKTFMVHAGDAPDESERDRPGGCSVDITTFGGLTDVLSNALTRGLHQDELKVRAFMDAVKARDAMTAEQLRDAAATEFGIERARIDAQVLAFLHCNCSHGDLSEPAKPADERPDASNKASAAGGTVSERNRPGVCSVDITTFGGLEDVLSNALMRGLHQKELKVRSFLDAARARKGMMTAEQLRDAAAAEFGIERASIDAQVLAFLHCNCTHGELGEPAQRTGERAAVSSKPSAPGGVVSVDLSELRSQLSVIAALLALLLLVSTATLIVLVKRSRAES